MSLQVDLSLREKSSLLEVPDGTEYTGALVDGISQFLIHCVPMHCNLEVEEDYIFFLFLVEFIKNVTFSTGKSEKANLNNVCL